jgi:hypothetical protein
MFNKAFVKGPCWSYMLTFKTLAYCCSTVSDGAPVELRKDYVTAFYLEALKLLSAGLNCIIMYHRLPVIFRRSCIRLTA